MLSSTGNNEGLGTYRYEAVSSDGTKQRGALPAPDRASAARDLRARGLVPTYVGTSAPPGLVRDLKRGIRGRPATVRFTEDLAAMLGAGVSLDRALAIAAETGVSEVESTAAREVLLALRGGASLADSLALRPELFSRLYVNTVRTGEAAGELPLVMGQLAAFERRREQLRGEILSALAYPVLLMLVGTASILVILAYVVPKLAASFQSSGFDAPVPMQVLMGASAFVHGWWPLAVLLPPAALLAVAAWTRSDSGRTRFDNLLLRLPILGRSMRNAETARFARAMATLLAATVPLVDALRVARSVLANRRFDKALETVVQGVRRGEGIALPVGRCGVFPALTTRLLAVGEETGELAGMFERLAEIYERRTRESLKRFTALFEPLVILALGIVVGFMVLGILAALASVQRMGV